jgi:hypothetical protein
MYSYLSRFPISSAVKHFFMEHSCSNNRLLYPPESSVPTTQGICSESATQFHLSDPPYENYFYSDCHLSSQVVVTSPLATSNLTIIGPRLLVHQSINNFTALNLSADCLFLDRMASRKFWHRVFLRSSKWRQWVPGYSD